MRRIDSTQRTPCESLCYADLAPCRGSFRNYRFKGLAVVSEADRKASQSNWTVLEVLEIQSAIHTQKTKWKNRLQVTCFVLRQWVMVTITNKHNPPNTCFNTSLIMNILYPKTSLRMVKLHKSWKRKFLSMILIKEDLWRSLHSDQRYWIWNFTFSSSDLMPK